MSALGHRRSENGQAARGPPLATKARMNDSLVSDSGIGGRMSGYGSFKAPGTVLEHQSRD